MIELIVYPKNKNPKLINPSPFCSKTEILLRLTNLDYKLNEYQGDPAKFPNKKLPVINYNSTIIPDSSLIQDFLIKEFKIKLDNHLSDFEKSQGFAINKMLEDHLYWSLLHERWLIDSNWEKLKADYFGHIPFLIRGLITKIIRKSNRKSALGHGMSRHSDKQVLDFGKKSIAALSAFLNDKDFILGEKVSSYDTTTYAFVSNLLHSELGPNLSEEVRNYNNLVDYDLRMYKLVFE